MFREGKRIHFCDRSELSLKKNSDSRQKKGKGSTGSAQEKRAQRGCTDHAGQQEACPDLVQLEKK